MEKSIANEIHWRIAVVIPYFQREAGLLHRALCSVAAQERTADQVIVVDDGSPRSAEAEITGELRNAIRGLTVIVQRNQGVGAARNSALDALAPETSAIALLDSDDRWQPTHLLRATTALSHGADFFFSNAWFEQGDARHFDEYPRRERLLKSPVVDRTCSILRWEDGPSALMGPACPFHTSTVVFKRTLMPELRFPVIFRRAGEDQVAFWDLLIRSSATMYCTEPTVVIGSGGFGIYRNSTFGSVAHLVRLADEIRLRRHVIHRHQLEAIDRRLMWRAIAVRRYAALVSALHLLRRRKQDALQELLYLLRADPACAAAWCLDLPKLLYRKMRGLPIAGGG